MRKASREAMARLPVVRKDYRNDEGYVFLDVPVDEASPDWTELTPEQREAVRPMSKTEARQWDAWHAPKGGAR